MLCVLIFVGQFGDHLMMCGVCIVFCCCDRRRRRHIIIYTRFIENWLRTWGWWYDCWCCCICTQNGHWSIQPIHFHDHFKSLFFFLDLLLMVFSLNSIGQCLFIFGAIFIVFFTKFTIPHPPQRSFYLRLSFVTASPKLKTKGSCNFHIVIFFFLAAADYDVRWQGSLCLCAFVFSKFKKQKKRRNKFFFEMKNSNNTKQKQKKNVHEQQAQATMMLSKTRSLLKWLCVCGFFVVVVVVCVRFVFVWFLFCVCVWGHPHTVTWTNSTEFLCTITYHSLTHTHARAHAPIHTSALNSHRLQIASD